MGRNRTAAYERTISAELLAVWNKYRRNHDGETISQKLGYSRPVIDRALNYGYVKTQNLTEQISKFFSDRLTQERETAAAMESELNNNQS